MIVLRCVGGLAFGLLVASCAGQIDHSKYALPQQDAVTPPVRFSGADINPDGTVENLPLGSRSGSGKKYAAKDVDRKRSDARPTLEFRQNRTVAASGFGAPAFRTGLNSQQAHDPVSTSALSSRSNAHLETPEIGSDRWEKEEAENQKLDRRLKERMKGICTGC